VSTAAADSSLALQPLELGPTHAAKSAKALTARAARLNG
jgi:hypothetical protein